MDRIILLTVVISLQLFISADQSYALSPGETIARQGNAKGAPACQSCHGEKGEGNAAAGYPYLAGQPEAYLVKQLQDFANNRRQNPVMQPFAAAMSTDEIDAVAAYYAGLPLPETAGGATDGAPAEKGARLAKQGNWSTGVPACFQCHGTQGQGIAPHFPAISGQPASYLEKQLEHWRKGERSNDPVGLMVAVVAGLEETDIQAVSRYLASQSPVDEQ